MNNNKIFHHSSKYEFVIWNLRFEISNRDLMSTLFSPLRRKTKRSHRPSPSSYVTRSFQTACLNAI